VHSAKHSDSEGMHDGYRLVFMSYPSPSHGCSCSTSSRQQA